jgi:hypothetical protein
MKAKTEVEELLRIWVALECGLGGLLHLWKLPVTGMLLGTYAVYYAYRLKQTSTFDVEYRSMLSMAFATVAIAKLMLTPHAGPGALLALGYQYLIILSCFSLLRPRLAVLSSALMIAGSTAIHKAISWYIVYGGSLLDAVDVWSRWLAQHLSLGPDGQHLLPVTYVALMLLWGVFSGILVIRADTVFEQFAKANPVNKRRRWRWWVSIGFITVAIAATVHDVSSLGRVAAFIGLYLVVILPLWRYITINYLLPWLQRRYPQLRSSHFDQLT